MDDEKPRNRAQFSEWPSGAGLILGSGVYLKSALERRRHVLRVAAHIGERKDRDRRLVRQRQNRRRWDVRGAAEIAHSIDPDWAGDVLDLLLAHILEDVIEPVAHLVTHRPAKANPARLGKRLQPRCHVHPMPEDVVLLGNHVAEIDADPEVDPLVLQGGRVSLGHAPLHLRRASHRIYNVRELREEAVAGVLYDPAAVLGDLWADQLPEMRLEPFVRPVLIRSHETRIRRHIGGQDRSEAADMGHFSPAVGSGLTNSTLKPVAALVRR
jgi:hypothetical protein